jgi:hypothetical protein
MIIAVRAEVLVSKYSIPCKWPARHGRAGVRKWTYPQTFKAESLGCPQWTRSVRLAIASDRGLKRKLRKHLFIHVPQAMIWAFILRLLEIDQDLLCEREKQDPANLIMSVLMLKTPATFRSILRRSSECPIFLERMYLKISLKRKRRTEKFP